MKVGINASFLRKPGTGIGQVTQHALTALFETHPENEYILYVEEEIQDFDVPDVVTVRVVKAPYKRDDLIRKTLWEKFELPGAVRQDQCDTLLSLYQSATVAPDHVRHVMVVHDLIPEVKPAYLNNWRKKLYWSFTKTAIGEADHIVAISCHTAEDIQKLLYVDAKKITPSLISIDPMLQEPIEPEEKTRVRTDYGLPHDYLLIAGGLEQRKNVEATIRAYNRLLDWDWQMPNLVIAGKLMPELAPLITDVEKIVSELHLEERVHILDFVPQEDLPGLYAAATLFLFPSTYEGFGMPLLESMSQGTPVLTSCHSSLPEVGGNAVAYTDCDEEAIAERMQELLLDHGALYKLGEKGRERAHTFTWACFVRDVQGAL